MYPSYGWADSYPHHRNQMAYIPSDNSRIDAIPPHVKMHPVAPNLQHQPWPYGGGYYHPVPAECHGCCHHSCFGSPYGFRPPYPHYPPPPPSYHFHEGCSSYPGSYPAYSVPPPHYSMEQPRYEYAKNASWDHHCCGCPHHLSKQESDKNTNIEPEQREVGQRSSDSLVPSEFKNHRYPILWIPPGYMKNIESEAKENGLLPHGSGNNGRLKPFNIKYLEPLKESGNDQGMQHQQAGGGGDSLPFPVFWLPYKNNEVEKDSQENNSCQVVDQSPVVGGNDQQKQLKTNEERSNHVKADSVKLDKHAVQKVIPVKQMETQAEILPKVIDRKANFDSVKNDNNLGEVKHSKDAAPKKPSSPKSSKLPPVCLRVDPLPRKKNGNGSSRSPSPPTTKGRMKEPATNNVSVPQQPSLETKCSQQQMESQVCLDKGKKAEQDKGNIRIIEVMDAAVDKNKQEPKQNLVSSNEAPSASQEKDDRSDAVAGELLEPSTGDVEKSKNAEKEETGEGNKAERKKISEEEAAVIIQSAYHGFEVRKSQPLKKLRQIAEVKKQVAEVDGRIRDLESSPNTHDKQKVVIGETIMSLLLKLDDIQGLHPTVREIRKSVAKELVGLQEKLDSLASRKPEASSEETTASEMTVDSIDAGTRAEVNQVHVQFGDSNLVESDSSLADKSHGPEAAEPLMAVVANTGMGENEVNGVQDDTGVLCQRKEEIHLVKPPMPEQTEQLLELPPLRVTKDNTSSAEEVLKDGNVNKVEEMPTVIPKETPDLQEAPTGSVCASASIDDVEVDREVTGKEVEINAELEGCGRQEENDGKDDKALEEAVPEEQDTLLESQEGKLVVVDPVEEDEMQEVKGVSHGKGETFDGVNGEVGNLEKGGVALKEVRLEPQPISVEPPESEAVPIQPVEEVQQLEEVILKDIQAPTEQRGILDIEEQNASNEDKTFGEGCEEITVTKDDEVNSHEIAGGETEVCHEFPTLHGEEEQGSPPMDEPKDILMKEEVGTEKDQPESYQFSPVESKISTDTDRKLVEENERLKEMMENLIKAGNEQLATICKLSGRVKDLEKKLSRKKKMKVRRWKTRADNLQDELKTCQV